MVFCVKNALLFNKFNKTQNNIYVILLLSSTNACKNLINCSWYKIYDYKSFIKANFVLLKGYI